MHAVYILICSESWEYSVEEDRSLFHSTTEGYGE